MSTMRNFNGPGLLFMAMLLAAWELAARHLGSPSFPGFVAVV